MGGTGAVPNGWTFKPVAIMNDREPPWLYTGTRFVSPLSMDAQNVILFEDRGVAEQIASHLKVLGVSAGIDLSVPSVRVKCADYATIKNAKHPPIRFVENTEPKYAKESKRDRERRDKRLGRSPFQHRPALSLSEKRAEDAEDAARKDP